MGFKEGHLYDMTYGYPNPGPDISWKIEINLYANHPPPSYYQHDNPPEQWDHVLTIAAISPGLWKYLFIRETFDKFFRIFI